MDCLFEDNAPANVSDFAGALEMAGRGCWQHEGARNGCKISVAPTGRSIWFGLAPRKHSACQRFRLRACTAPLERLIVALAPAPQGTQPSTSWLKKWQAQISNELINQ